MTALTDPISGLSYGWALGENNWNTGMDSNLVQLGATINISVLDFVASPVVTTNGTRYIVTTGSGAFAGKNNKLAARVAGAWVFYTLPEGCIVYDEDTNKHYKFEGGSYVLVVDLSGYLTSTTAASTYQTQAGMSNYLTTANMSNYLTTANAATTYTSIANSRYQFVSNAGTTYTVPASAVTANGNTIIELSNNSLTSITINTSTATGKTAGDSVTIHITGTYAAQLLVASGVTLNGTLAFSANAKIKTLIYRGSDVWTVLGG
jgi:hypothetical protein